MKEELNATSVPSINPDGTQDSTAVVYQQAVQAQIMQWVAAMHNFYTTPLQYNKFSQHDPSLPTGTFGASLMPQTSPFNINISGPTPPAHVADDVLRMIYPVGSSPDDDTILARILRDSATNGKTYRQAIEGLHGINNHPAHFWKDYYLDHRPRINLLVSRISDQSSRTVKVPFLSTPIASQSKDASYVAPLARKIRSHLPLRGRSEVSDRTPSGRATINSITAHPPPRSEPHAQIVIPDPPSREPSPPSQIVAFGQNGNASDVTFFAGIDRLAKKYKERTKESAVPNDRKSWTSSSSNGSLPSALKRKLGSVEFGPDRFGLGEKRLREGTGSFPTA